MAGTANNLVWLDMEMTGLNPDGDRIIEMAMVVTNSDLELVAESPSWVVHQSDEVLAAMDEWNQKTHGRSGLIDKVRAATTEIYTLSLHDALPICKSGCQRLRPSCEKIGVFRTRAIIWQALQTTSSGWIWK